MRRFLNCNIVFLPSVCIPVGPSTTVPKPNRDHTHGSSNLHTRAPVLPHLFFPTLIIKFVVALCLILRINVRLLFPLHTGWLVCAWNEEPKAQMSSTHSGNDSITVNLSTMNDYRDICARKQVQHIQRPQSDTSTVNSKTWHTVTKAAFFLLMLKFVIVTMQWTPSVCKVLDLRMNPECL